MREYETTFIVQPEISEEGCQEIFGRVDQVLERAGAARLLHDDQGKRRLAYEIRKFQKGRYVTTTYLDDGSAVGPLERALRFDESVLRFLTVLVDPEVQDAEARKARAADEEKVRAERARERAAREAEEERARQAAGASAAQAAEAAEAATERAEDDADEASDEPSDEPSDEVPVRPSDDSEEEEE